VGYHGDQEISQWPFRDYVIQSFNQNLAYDQFIKEQLAGDLLPDPTRDQLVASGYNRLNQTTEEGGAQAKEYLSIYFADRVRNVSQVFLGSTLGCAQCHDHKYDPFTAKDFYAFGAFFADLEERGVYGGRGLRPPVLKLPTPEQQSQIDGINKSIAESNREIAKLRVQLLKSLKDWHPSESVNQTLLDDEKPNAKQFSGTWNFVSGPDVPVRSGRKSRLQESNGLHQHYVNQLEDPIEIDGNVKVFASVYLDPANPPKAIMLQFNDGSTWNHRVVWGTDQIDYGRRESNWPGYYRKGKLPKSGQWVQLEVDLAEIGFSVKPSKNKSPTKISGIAFTQFGGKAWWDEVTWEASLPTELASIIKVPASDRTEIQSQKLAEYYLASSQQWGQAIQRLDDLRSELTNLEQSVTTTVVSRATQPREIRILPRGNWQDDSGQVVQPAVPEFLGGLESSSDVRLNRLDLANWICQPENPLTARTMVNRIWSLLFGRGICTSVDDFGGQGTYPSNPELLDALAFEFVDSGWDVKQLIRVIVTSQAYQRSSRPTPDLIEQDPYNDTFARQGRFRVDAEVVRDAALFVSGRLVEKRGGPSARPYQPIGYYAQLNFPTRTYLADLNDNQYRRGLYTHWQRTFLHPMMKAFDAPSREECTCQRARSSTPLQALTLLNDPTFVEAARIFAARILREGGSSQREKLIWAYRAAVSHPPENEIVEILLGILEKHRKEFKADPDSAEKLLSVGLAKIPTDIDKSELAAWTSIARTIFNLQEMNSRY
ncbi:MAG: DUF1549 and DUF1553 domain-containing protein, partial [Planctomycetota bacterium]